MRLSIISCLTSLFLIISITGCVSTKITAPAIHDKAAKEIVPLKIDYKNLPGEDSIALVNPNGKKSGVTNDPGRLDKVMIPAIQKIVRNKGYAITDDVNKARGVLTVDFSEFGIYWSAGPSKGSGRIKTDVNHYITPKNSENKLWKWNYKNEKEYGELPGNCIAGIAGCTIIGIIPFMIYVNSKGGTEGTQMTKEGNALLADYFAKFEAALPAAGTVVK